MQHKYCKLPNTIEAEVQHKSAKKTESISLSPVNIHVSSSVLQLKQKKSLLASISMCRHNLRPSIVQYNYTATELCGNDGLLKQQSSKLWKRAFLDKMRQLSVRRAAIHFTDIIRPRYISKNLAPFILSLSAGFVLFLDIISWNWKKKDEPASYHHHHHSRQRCFFSWHLRSCECTHLVTRTVKKRPSFCTLKNASQLTSKKENRIK